MSHLSTLTRIFVAIAAVYGVLVSGSLAAADGQKGGEEGSRPNVIVILTDDNVQLSWTIGGNFCKFLYLFGVLGKV
jgi:hypothetical protein